ncbi:hypothetical protein BDF20DRAFT_966026 [Mycotypha africana]|uniref:uncharacterized protein n=1 Tax=Mycotypha africana TaxID=64632 RepID=UPI002300C6ED|nr:uncharacterized protein BDF20DRAFT_966026 [Mycotypha africana]KAI8967306.1 hypothetical protein BDF20DRAFT_966026 [Mycotypha africana]
MVCSHIANTTLHPPSAFAQVHKEECTQCFDSQDGAEGIDVCLSCFNGGCLDKERHHALTHYQLSGHPLTLNIKRKLCKTSNTKRTDEDSPPPFKITKVAIEAENEADKYEYETKVRCYICQTEEDKDVSPKINSIVEAIMNSLSSAKQSEVKAWQEDDITACEHTLCLTQEPPKKLEAQALAHCADCELNQNLWLCLVCGNLGCGRRQYDGTGGNQHAIEHFEKTGHAVNVKLGTITPEGTADIYCYSCDDARLDENLSLHLANWGINVAQQTKTEKSMVELQLEQNLHFDFSMTTEDGKQLQPKFGPGYTGFKNLGNSCYMASVLQSIFNLPIFQRRYGKELEDHSLTCTQDPAQCWYCQLHKLADGLLSGRYSLPVQEDACREGDSRQTPSPPPQQQTGIAPAMFKTLVGKDHHEFSTMRQQDAFEFFQFLLKQIQQKENKNKENDPTQVFQFELEQRLQCGKCKRVRYQKDATTSISINVPARLKKDSDSNAYEPVTLEECLDAFVEPEVVEGYKCPQCNEKTTAFRSVKFSTFPEILVMNPRRFAFMDWVPQKLNIPILFPDRSQPIQLDKYLSQGQQPDEELLPDDETMTEAATAEPAFNQADLDQLLMMGFSENRCKRALLNTGHRGADMAMNWIFEHMEDPDVDDPLPSQGGAGTAPTTEADETQITMLQDMGFTLAQAKKALRETNNNTERAVEWLFSHPEEMGEDDTVPTGNNSSGGHAPLGDATPPFHYALDSFVSHKGTSVHCGHYVAHVYKEGEWVLFNDTKVAVSPTPPMSEAYLYFLKRQHE